MIRPLSDPTTAAEVVVAVTVPPSGPPVAIAAKPNLIRLRDATEGSFALHLDNRAANFPQVFRLAGTDPEGVVEFSFSPLLVEVPPGQVVEATVRFAAPGDVVVVLGKGHERYQEIGGRKVPFSDAEVIKEAIGA